MSLSRPTQFARVLGDKAHMGPRHLLQRLSRAAFLDALAPRRCPGCDFPDTRDAPAAMCAACAPLLEASDGVVERLVCGTAWHAPFVFGGPLADAVRRFKYAGRSEYSWPLAQLALPSFLRAAEGDVAVTYVPLHPDRLRARGYNQAALLARAMADGAGLPLCDLLLRRRDTPALAGLERGARARTIADAFACREIPVASRTLLLVDDVGTTGSTLSEALAVLRGHYPTKRLLAFTLARVARQLERADAAPA